MCRWSGAQRRSLRYPRGDFFEWSTACWDRGYVDKTTGRLIGGWIPASPQIKPLSLERASMWAQQEGVKLTSEYCRYCAEFPPATALSELELTLRITRGLKTRIEKRAREEGISPDRLIVCILEEAMAPGSGNVRHTGDQLSTRSR